MSTAYYALFHTLAGSCADLVVGSRGSERSEIAWRQVYRALDHGLAKRACENDRLLGSYPEGIRRFADLFVAMQIKRHAADYDPARNARPSAVLQDIADCEQVMRDFGKVPAQDRRAFAAHLLFRSRS